MYKRIFVYLYDMWFKKSKVRIVRQIIIIIINKEVELV